MKEWLHKFKLAVIEEDTGKIGILLDELSLKELDERPALNELKQVQSLMKEAEKVVLKHKDKLAPAIQKIKLAKKFF